MVQVIVIGAGFAGLSTAYHLARKNVKNILVIEQEKQLGGHASGRNAGMIRQAVADPVLVRLAKEGRDSLREAAKKDWAGLDFKSNGSFLLAKEEKGLAELKDIKRATSRNRVKTFILPKESVERRVSILKGADFTRALFCPADAWVDIEALMKGFLKALRKYRVPVLCGHRIERIEKNKKGFKIRAGGNIFYSEKIVNAAGAWAGPIGALAKAARIPFRAYRRHLFLSAPFSARAHEWPFVWDLSHHLYFRPKGNRLLLSPCDRDFFKLNDQKKEKAAEGTDARMKTRVLRKLRHFSPHFDNLKIETGLAGLRTMVPDGRFVVGEDPEVKGFFWVAGLGGHGVTTSFSVGRLAADLILGKKTENYITRALSPKRFCV